MNKTNLIKFGFLLIVLKSYSSKRLPDQKQIKGYISPELKERFDKKIERQYGKGKHTTQVLRKLLLKYVDGETKLK